MSYNKPTTFGDYFMTDIRSTSQKLFGATGFPFMDSSKRSGFFSPYQSGKDFGLRAASIITAPILFSMNSVAALLEASAELLNAFAKLCIGELSESKDHVINCGKRLILAPIFLIAAILSPLGNLIDLIGGAINSIKHSSQTPNEENLNMGFP